MKIQDKYLVTDMENIGKKKCEVLKKVRKAVADAHGIAYEPAVCTHEGECKGTCPKCEAEVRYIETEIKKKYGEMTKKAAVTVGTVVTTGMALASCWHNAGIPETTGIEPAQLQGEPVEEYVIDSTQVGEKLEFNVPVPEGDSIRYEPVTITLTQEMVGERYYELPDSGTNLFKAIEEARKKK